MSTANSTPEHSQAKRPIRAVAGTNLDGASAHNRRVIFDALRINGALTRADLARATQLTPQTVSNIVDSLQVRRAGRRRTSRAGRAAASPPVPIASCRRAPAPSASSSTATRCWASWWIWPARR